jgi:hypothetical protein
MIRCRRRRLRAGRTPTPIFERFEILIPCRSFVQAKKCDAIKQEKCHKSLTKIRLMALEIVKMLRQGSDQVVTAHGAAAQRASGLMG